jgi:4-hydroxy-3-methylbut-2-enyl diphosphate reductase
MPIVILDVHAGFYYGVKRVLELARKLKENNDVVYTDGPLIHKEAMIRHLEEQGICSCADPLSISRNPKICLLIRAHGISPERLRWLKSLNLPIADATCPDFGKIAEIVLSHEQKGHTILIYGLPSHPEVIRLVGCANNILKDLL